MEEPNPNGMVVVVVPTYNEAENLPELAQRIFALDIANTKLIIVDDNSPDGTSEVARDLAVKSHGKVDLIQRRSKQGLATAYIEGFSRAVTKSAEYVIQMDADLSHAPEYLPAFLEELKKADVVVGSRYSGGGKVSDSWNRRRRYLSHMANLGIRIVLGLRVRDTTSGFKGFQARVLESLDITSFTCKGFGFQAEMAYECQRRAFRITEYPIEFKERTRGQSKMSTAIVFDALLHLLALRCQRWRRALRK